MSSTDRTENRVPSPMVTAVESIIATTQGRMPERNACTPAYFMKFLRSAAIKRIMKKEGITTPRVAKKLPKMPPWEEPIKVAILTARGPGVDSETAMKFKNSSSDSQP